MILQQTDWSDDWAIFRLRFLLTDSNKTGGQATSDSRFAEPIFVVVHLIASEG